MNRVSEEQWQIYEREGYLKLGRLLTDPELQALQERIDDIMLGNADIDYDRLLMQLDSDTGQYDDLGEQSVNPTLCHLERQGNVVTKDQGGRSGTALSTIYGHEVDASAGGAHETDEVLPELQFSHR